MELVRVDFSNLGINTNELSLFSVEISVMRYPTVSGKVFAEISAYYSETDLEIVFMDQSCELISSGSKNNYITVDYTVHWSTTVSGNNGTAILYFKSNNPSDSISGFSARVINYFADEKYGTTKVSLGQN